MTAESDVNAMHYGIARRYTAYFLGVEIAIRVCVYTLN